MSAADTDFFKDGLTKSVTLLRVFASSFNHFSSISAGFEVDVIHRRKTGSYQYQR